MRSICLYVVCICILISCVIDRDENTASKITINDVLPSFSIYSLEGDSVFSDSLNGKVALIIFFDTECKDCRRELPKAEQIWKELGSSDSFALLPISRGQTAEEIKKYWQSVSFTMPYYLDYDRVAYSLFAWSIIPRFYLVNKQGIVCWMGTEKIDESENELVVMIKRLINME